MHTDIPFELTVVDNASSDGTLEYLSKMKSKGVVKRLYHLKRNMGVAVAANLGWSAVDSDYYVKLDNDIELQDPSWLRNLIEILESNRDVGAIGYKFCDWHKTEKIVLKSGTPFLKFQGLGGACVCIPRRIHKLLGYWNEDYGFYGFEDLDYGNRIIHNRFLSGYYDCDTCAVHLESDLEEYSVVEERKSRQVESKSSGLHLYLLNKFLFENNVRAQYVRRKYVPILDEDRYTFRLNEEYKSIARLLNSLRPSFKYEIKGDEVLIDTSLLAERIDPQA